MSYTDPNGLIAVWITSIQREILLLLVNRRINDLDNSKRGSIPERLELSHVKTELEQAGT